MRRTIRGSRVIVTGASSGIGRELALELARRGASLIINARRTDRLAAVASNAASFGSKVIPIVGDLTNPDLRNDLCAAARTELNGLDILINNAGVGALGEFADASPERLRRIMEVNFFAPAELIRTSLPLLRLGNRPMVVNISSILGHRAVPKKSEYCASKFALHGLSDAIRAELKSCGVDVLLVSPSTTETEFTEHVLEKAGDPRPRRRGMPANIVARKTISAIERGRHEIILSASGKMVVWLDRLFPTLADYLIARFG